MAPEEMFSGGVYEDEGNPSANVSPAPLLTPDQQEAKMRAECAGVARVQNAHRARQNGTMPANPSPSAREQRPVPPAGRPATLPVRTERRCTIYLTGRPHHASDLLLVLRDIAGIKTKEAWAMFRNRNRCVICHNISETCAQEFRARLEKVGATSQIRYV